MKVEIEPQRNEFRIGVRDVLFGNIRGPLVDVRAQLPRLRRTLSVPIVAQPHEAHPRRGVTRHLERERIFISHRSIY